MKSKAHCNKCCELGIVPVPTQVQDSQIKHVSDMDLQFQKIILEDINNKEAIFQESSNSQTKTLEIFRNLE